MSEQTGLSVDAIRFYEKQRLLEHPPRTEGGFRLFNTQDIQRIQFIRRAQRLGFSLPEIRELLVIERVEGETCSHVRELLQAKVAEVHSKVEELRLLEGQLTRKLRKCERKLNASDDSHDGRCPVLDEIARAGSDEN
ncbi:MAG TPA: MerR family DNA-binding protein [Bryobacteraceae bacterium]|nr:MerR family DNA-binding protein [Bryobacteraceae bacterium]